MDNRNSLSFRQIIDTLSATINPVNHVMDLVPSDMQELFQKSMLISLSILKTSEMVHNSGGQIDYQQLYQLLKPLLTDPEVINSYNKWKSDLCCMTPQMLKHKRLQVIFDVLKRDIMKYDEDAFNYEVNEINDDEITQWISCEEKLDDNLKKELAKLKRYLIKEGDIIMIDRQKFGKYAMKHIKAFSYEDARAMFELDATLDMVNADLVAQNPRLQTIINKYRLQPEPFNAFAPAKIIKSILTQTEVLALVSNKQKYTAQWIEQFVDNLMTSEHGRKIAEDWANSKKRIKIPALVAGCLISAGVFNCSKPKLARAIRVQHDFTVTIDSYATYMGCKKEQPYLEWVQNYVKSN